MNKHYLVVCLIAGMVTSGAALPAVAGSDRAECPGGHPFVATVVTLGGKVDATRAEGGPLQLAIGTPLCPGDGISTGPAGRVELRFAARDTTVGLSRNSSLKLPAAGDTDANVDMQSGMMRFLSSVRQFFAVRTRLANAGIDGTEAVIAVDGRLDDSLFVVQAGDVTLTARQGEQASVSVDAGRAGFISKNVGLTLATTANVPAKFRGLVADPAGASDWAIYFPPVLGPDAPAVAQEAAARLGAGDPDGAEALLAGRQDAASLSLAAVVAVLRNRTAEGAALAARAVATDPALAAAHVAQSYALQAQGQVTAARRAAERAVEADPADVNARARLAELLLTEGDRAGALDALAAIPEDGHTAISRGVEGLALLAANRRQAAIASFEQGIALDSEAPLPRLGLGLAKIRAGEVEGGRRELELAAALDPRRASLRTWLGRAYAAEGRAHKAASQFEEAKARDPDDPTPWLFSAQEKFSANRPIEARADLEAAEARGQSRAPLRSEAGLGEDRAVRSAALGRVDQVLGFRDQAILAGTAATEADPTNPAAHFLLSDVLGARPGREISRTSALLQAQVYDPPGKTPIRPQRAESDLALLETQGASRATFAEFAPFFDSDGVRVQGSGFGGTQATLGDEVSVSALYRGFSLGVGQFHYQTGGYRANNDVVSVQGKAQVLPWLDFFGEYRYRNTDAGDRSLEFDLESDAPGFASTEERDLGRFGFHAEIGANQDLVGLLSYVEQDASSKLPNPSFGTVLEEENQLNGYDVQVQHVGRFGSLTTTAGLAYDELDSRTQRFTVVPVLDLRIPGPVVKAKTKHLNLYGYGTLRLADLGFLAGAELTAGLSVDAYDEGLPGGRDSTEVNPKIGARVMLTDIIIVRGAYTRTLKPDQPFDQRLEPMTVAGFAQYFDQYNGATIDQAAAGIDARILPWLWIGAEGARRWIETEIGGMGFDTDEIEVRGYANATLANQISATLEVSHEHDRSKLAGDLDRFEVTEFRGGVSYFHPSGFFVSAGAGYVWHQFKERSDSGTDDFPIVDAAIGFRLPENRGVLSLELQNALDENFHFEDRPLVTVNNPPAVPRFAREFTVLARATFNFQ